MHPLRSRPTGALSGVARVPGDKSISHRSLMLGALAAGESVIEGLLEGEDVLRTADAMRRLGANAVREADGTWRVHGRGLGGLREPTDILDLGNAGTGARLLMGLLATHPLTAFMTGDASLRSRPMARVAKPLQEMGARIVARDGYRLPLAVIGAVDPMPIDYRLPVASAQVKSAILLAGLNTPGETSVTEPEPTRNHTELMLKHFGVEVRVAMTNAGRRTTIVGQPEISGRRIEIPADPSSAAFPLVAAALLPGSDITLGHVGINPHRIGLIETLREMGADITFDRPHEDAGEPVADIRVRAHRLVGVDVPPPRAPSMIDEYPILAVAAACATGTTVMRGLGELRIKESDRLTAIAHGLRACGVPVEDAPDSLVVRGTGAPPPGGGRIVTSLDHRIAMAFLVLGMAAKRPVDIDDGAPIETSFPGFVPLMNGLGAQIGSPDGGDAPAAEG